MGAFNDFKQFAMKGSVVDLAAGVIIGGAFGKVVSVLVDRVLMPPLGLLVGGVHFTQLRIVLKAAGADGKGEVAIGYGDFIESLVDFLAVAVALFLIVKVIGSFRKWERRAIAAAEAAAAKVGVPIAPHATEPAPPAVAPAAPAPAAAADQTESVEVLKQMRDLLAKIAASR